MKSTFIVLVLSLFLNCYVIASEVALKKNDPFKSSKILESVSCKNNKKTKCSLIKKELKVKIGEEVSDKDLESYKIRLKLMGLFKDVKISMTKGSERGKVNLVIDVEEESALYTVTSLSFGNSRDNSSDATKFVGGLDFTLGHRNLFGKGKNLSLSGSFENNPLNNSIDQTSFLLRYNDPSLFGSKKWFLNTELYGRHYTTAISHQDNYLGSLEIGRRYGNYSYWTLGYVSAYNDFGGAQRVTYASQEPFTNSSQNYVSLGYGYNTQDDLFFPTRGFRADLKFLMLVDYKNDDYLVSSDRFFDIDLRRTFSFRQKYFISPFLENRNVFFDEDNFLNSGIGVELAYQNRFNKNKSISDLRYFIAPSITGLSYNSFNGVRTNYAASAGVKLRHEKLGLIRFQFTWRNDDN